MPRPVNKSLDDDPEYIKFTEYIDSRQLSVATGKSYKACYRKLRTLLNKPIRDTAEDSLTFTHFQHIIHFSHQFRFTPQFCRCFKYIVFVLEKRHRILKIFFW